MKLYNYDQKHQKMFGFTLIELMIVISIIGILALLSLVGLRATLTQARDMQRKSNITNIGKAVISCAMDKNSEHFTPGNDLNLSNTSPIGKELIDNKCISKIPTDPINYAYQYVSNGDNFRVCINSESKANTAICYEDSGSGSGGSGSLTTSPVTDPDHPADSYTEFKFTNFPFATGAGGAFKLINDVDGDGRKDFVVGGGYEWHSAPPSYPVVFIISADGKNIIRQFSFNIGSSGVGELEVLPDFEGLGKDAIVFSDASALSSTTKVFIYSVSTGNLLLTMDEPRNCWPIASTKNPNGTWNIAISNHGHGIPGPASGVGSIDQYNIQPGNGQPGSAQAIHTRQIVGTGTNYNLTYINDINNDGMDDLVYDNQSIIYVETNTGSPSQINSSFSQVASIYAYDLNNDGQKEIIAGDTEYNISPHKGKISIYNLTGTQLGTINGRNNDEIGDSISVITGKNNQNIIVTGSHGSGGGGKGAIYFFSGPSLNNYTLVKEYDGENSGDYFGKALATFGYYGEPDEYIITGAFKYNRNTNKSGAIYLKFPDL